MNSLRTTTSDVDFDLHGLVGIRVQGGSESDVAAVRRQLGPLESPLRRAPDIVIRFVDHLPAPRSLNYLGLDEAGFTEDAFWILRSKHKATAKVMIPIERIGEDCEIVCETGLPAVPLLIAIINLTALQRGGLPLHASAFTHEGTGMLATGWSKGGKTETLLSFMAHGARYIADEWAYLHGDGRVSGIPEPIRVWDWHLESMPHYRRRAKSADLWRLRAIHSLQAILGCLPGGKSRLGKMKSRLLPLLKRQAFVDMEAARLFGRDRMQLDGRLDKILFVVSHASPEIRIEPIDGAEVAERMVHSLQYEQFPFMGFYRMFRFAFPERASALVERTEAMQRELLHKFLANKEAYAVYHPYPVRLESLFEAIAPLCVRGEGKLHQARVPGATVSAELAGAES